jgi:hypothetical protein
MPRSGVTPVEVIVVIVVLSVVVLIAFMALPRQRENARLAGCRQNLTLIGRALVLYDSSERTLPSVPRLSRGMPVGPGPLKQVLQALVLPDFTELAERRRPPPHVPGEVPNDGPIAGFVCQSDPNAITPGAFPAPISYRATTGDQPDGWNGGFAPGSNVQLAEIDSGDGLSFTAAFSERLVGNRRNRSRRTMNYAIAPGPLTALGCPTTTDDAWRGDAGRSWAEATWRSTLYNHALEPNASGSCLASDSGTALMGASSGHTRGVNVLIFDGSVRTVAPTVDLNVWKALATIDGGTRPVSANGLPFSHDLPNSARRLR